jgi:hypothetical protein
MMPAAFSLLNVLKLKSIIEKPYATDTGDSNTLVLLSGRSLASTGALSVLIAVAQSNNEQRQTKARRTDRP